MPREINVGGISFSISAETGEFRGKAEEVVKILQRFEKEAGKTGRTTQQVAKQYGVSTNQLKVLQQVISKTAEAQSALNRSAGEGGDNFSQKLQDQATETQEALNAIQELREELELLGRTFTDTGTESLAVERAFERLSENKILRRLQGGRPREAQGLIDLARVKQETTEATNITIQEEKRLTAEVRSLQKIRTAVGRTEQALRRQDNEAQNELILEEERAANLIRKEEARQFTIELRAEAEIRKQDNRANNQVLLDEEKTRNRLRLENRRAIIRQDQQAQKAALAKEVDDRRQANKLEVINEQLKNNLILREDAERRRRQRDAEKEKRRIERETAKQSERLAQERTRQAKQVADAEVRQSRRVQAANQTVARSFDRIGRRLLNFRAIIGVAVGTGVFGALIRQTTQYSATLVETARGLGITAVELDATRRVFESFGLEALQVDRALVNIAKAAADARAGIVEARRAILFFDIEEEQFNPLGILRGITESNISELDPGLVSRYIGQLVGERARTVVAGLLAQPGAFTSELERQARDVDRIATITNDQLIRNKELDQAFVDLTNIIRRNLIGAIADNADGLETFTRKVAELVPVVVNVGQKLANFVVGPAGLITAGGIGVGIAGGGLINLRKQTRELGGLTKALTAGAAGFRIATVGLASVVGLLAHFWNQARERVAEYNDSLSIANTFGERQQIIINALAQEQISIQEANVRTSFLVQSISASTVLQLRRSREEAQKTVDALEKRANQFSDISGAIDTRDPERALETLRALDIQQKLNEARLQLRKLDSVLNTVDRLRETFGEDLNFQLVENLEGEIRQLTSSIKEWERVVEVLRNLTSERDQLQANLARIEARSALSVDDSTRTILLRTKEEVDLLKDQNQVKNERIRLNDEEIRQTRENILLKQAELALIESEFNVGISTSTRENLVFTNELVRNNQVLNTLADELTASYDEQTRALRINNQLSELDIELVKARANLNISTEDRENLILLRQRLDLTNTNNQLLDARASLNNREILTKRELLALSRSELRVLEAQLKNRISQQTLIGILTNNQATSFEEVSGKIREELLLIEEAGLRFTNSIIYVHGLYADLLSTIRTTITTLDSGPIAPSLEDANVLLGDFVKTRDKLVEIQAEFPNLIGDLGTKTGLEYNKLAIEYNNLIDQLLSTLSLLRDSGTVIPEIVFTKLRAEQEKYKDTFVELTDLSKVWEDILGRVAERIADIGVNLAKNLFTTKDIIGSLKSSLADLAAEILRIYLLTQITSGIDNLLIRRGYNPIFTSRQSGGFARGLTLVGEQGPELVDFTQPGRVYSNATLQALASNRSAGAGNVFNISVQSDNPAAVRAEVINLLPLIEEASVGRYNQELERDSITRKNIQNLIRR